MLNINFENTETIDQVITDFYHFDKTNKTQITVAKIIQSYNSYLLLEYNIKCNSLDECLKIYNDKAEEIEGTTIEKMEYFNNEDKAISKIEDLKDYGYYDNDTIREAFEEFCL